MKSETTDKSKLTQEIFLRLLDRWDIKDAAGAEGLAKASARIAEGFLKVQREAQDGKPVPEAPAKGTAR